MTVLAFDGVTLAADTLSCNNSGQKRYSTKIWREGQCLMGGSGEAIKIAQMKFWYLSGADPEKLPDFQRGDGYTDFWVVGQSGKILKYEDGPFPIEFHDKVFAAGSGGDLARGAMEMGASAEDAVRVACKHNAFCGGPITVLTLREP